MMNSVLFGSLMTWITPLWQVAVGAVVAVVALFVVSSVVRLIAPKVAAIAWTTGKEALSQPLFYVILTIGVFGLLLFPFVPYHTFGEDIKIVKDSGLTLITILSIVLALWTASVSIADEIDGRTALTLLSKPVGRRQFIFGKFLGILVPVAVLFIVLGSLFLTTVSYKVVYDARETSNPEPTVQQCAQEIVQIVPGLALAFLETIVLASISVAIATRLPILANMIICGVIYALGNLTPVLVSSSAGEFEIVSFFGRLLATILPALGTFNIYPAIATGQAVPLSYIGMAAVYCALYSSVAILVALLLFEDRDLA